MARPPPTGRPTPGLPNSPNSTGRRGKPPTLPTPVPSAPVSAAPAPHGQALGAAAAAAAVFRFAPFGADPWPPHRSPDAPATHRKLWARSIAAIVHKRAAPAPQPAQSPGDPGDLGDL